MSYGNGTRTLTDHITATPEGMRIWQQERAIFEITERLCELMADQNISRADLAKKLGTTRSYITQLLDGTANMTIRKLSDVYLALNRQFHADDGPISTDNDQGPVIYKLHYQQTTPARPEIFVRAEYSPLTTAV